LKGNASSLSTLAVAQPFTVIAVTSPSCPLSRKFAPTLAALEREWKSRGVQFLFTGAIPSDPPEALAALAAEHHFQGPCTADAPQALLRALDAKTTTEVFILDRARTLRYRGAVDDQYGIGYQKDQRPAPPDRSHVRARLRPGNSPAASRSSQCHRRSRLSHVAS
jgi:hypothetical protein